MENVSAAAPAARPKTPSRRGLAAIFASGNVISLFLKTAWGMLTIKIVEPGTLGVFNAFMLVQGYIPFLQIGLVHGLYRELPYYLSKQDHVKAREFSGVAQAFSLMVSSTIGLVLLGVAVWYVVQGEYLWATGWAMTAFMSFSNIFGRHYLNTLYQATYKFDLLAYGNILYQIVCLLSLILVYYFSFYGLCLRMMLAESIFFLLLWYWRPIHARILWNFQDFKNLLKIGLPILMNSQIYIAWAYLDYTLVLHFLGTEGLGLYTLAMMVAPAIQLIPESVAQITSIRMVEQYAKKETSSALLPIALKPTIYSLLGMVPIILSAWYIIDPLTRLLVPRYSEGISAAQWAIIQGGTASFCFINNAYVVVKKQLLYGIILLIGMISYLLALFFLSQNGLYLAAFPQAMIIGRIVAYLCFWSCFYFLAAHKNAKGKELSEIPAGL